MRCMTLSCGAFLIFGFFRFQFDGTNHKEGEGRWTIRAEHRRYEVPELTSEMLAYHVDSTNFDRVIEMSILMEDKE